MPFQKGNKLGGRKAYILEQEQVEKMRKIVDKDLEIVERLQSSSELSPLDKAKLEILQSRVSKIMDKLHATKEAMEHSGEVSLPTPLFDYVRNNNSNGKGKTLHKEN